MINREAKAEAGQTDPEEEEEAEADRTDQVTMEGASSLRRRASRGQLR
jgi:hypothetical protein